MKTLVIFAAAAALAASARGEQITAEPDAFLEYIEATGSQYIDTEVNAETGLKAQIDFAWAADFDEKSDWSLLDATIDSSSSDKRTRFLMCHMFKKKPYFGYGVKQRKNPAFSVPFVGGQRCEIITDMTDPDSLELYQDGVKTFSEEDLETFKTNDVVNLNLNLYVFACNLSNKAAWFGQGRLYELKIWKKNLESGELDLIRHYLPCKKDGRAGLYDKVCHTISYSYSNDNNFIAGPVTNTVTPTPWKALQEQLNEGGTVTLTNDVTATSIDMTLTVTKAVTLDLAGHTLNAAGLFRVIEISRGGHLTLTNGTETAGTITGGIASVGGGVYVDEGGTFTMTGGTISGNLALSGTATATVTGDIEGNVTIATGQVFTDGNGHYYSGTLSDDDKTAINGQTLTRLTALQLADDADNSAAIAKCNGITIPVVLQGRKLYRDGAWNTLCLPFAVTDGNTEDEISFTGTPLEGADVRALDNANLTDGTLTLNFTDEGYVTAIEAGKPYIIKWANDENITNPVFTDVTIDASASTTVNFTGGEFKGTYSPVGLTVNDKSNLFLGNGNTLYYPNDANNQDGKYYLNAFRAYFHLNEPSGVREINLNFEDGTTSLRKISNEKLVISNYDYYTLDGRKLQGKPTTKGLYIVNGRVVVK